MENKDGIVESQILSINQNVSEIKVDIRALRGKVDNYIKLFVTIIVIVLISSFLVYQGTNYNIRNIPLNTAHVPVNKTETKSEINLIQSELDVLKEDVTSIKSNIELIKASIEKISQNNL